MRRIWDCYESCDGDDGAVEIERCILETEDGCAAVNGESLGVDGLEFEDFTGGKRRAEVGGGFVEGKVEIEADEGDVCGDGVVEPALAVGAAVVRGCEGLGDVEVCCLEGERGAAEEE